jgi:hypothetical protein
MFREDLVLSIISAFVKRVSRNAHDRKKIRRDVSNALGRLTDAGVDRASGIFMLKCATVDLRSPLLIFMELHAT